MIYFGLRRWFPGVVLCCLLLLPYGNCQAGYKVRTLEIKGVTYMLLKDVAGFYALSYSARGNDVLLQAKGVRLSLNLDRREAVVNGVLTNLCFAPVGWRGEAMVSEPDFRLVLDPVLRPQVVPRTRVRTIMIDAGHGGNDQGTSAGGIREKDITLYVARQLAKALQRQGYVVKMTRATDRTLTLDDRSAALERASADCFISFHVNSARSEVKGIETFLLLPRGTASTYNTEVSNSRKRGNAFDRANMRLAYDVHRNVLRLTRAEDRGVKHANFAVLREASAPAILLEMGFLSNASERRKLIDPVYLNQIVDGVVAGLSTYRRNVESR